MTYSGNVYLEKIASRQKLDDFAEDPKSFQEPVVKNILTGFTYGGLGGSVYGMRDQLPAMSAALMGQVSGGVVGGLIGRRFHIPTRATAGNIEKWTIGAIPGTIGTLVGAKIGQDQAEKHNNRLLNRIKEKYYE